MEHYRELVDSYFSRYKEELIDVITRSSNLVKNQINTHITPSMHQQHNMCFSIMEDRIYKESVKVAKAVTEEKIKQVRRTALNDDIYVELSKQKSVSSFLDTVNKFFSSDLEKELRDCSLSKPNEIVNEIILASNF